MFDAALVLALALVAAPCPVNAFAVDIIAHREGYYKPGTLPHRYNNPGSLKYTAQPGALLGKAHFAIFNSAEAGFDALLSDLDYKATHHKRLDRAWHYMRKYDRRSKG